MTIREPVTDVTPLPDIDDVAPFSPDDEACFAEVRAVLSRHNRLQRFGLCLLHDHFEVAPHEILVEVCDPIARTLISSPVQRTTLSDKDIVQTSWRLDQTTALMGCLEACGRSGDKHVPKHSRTR
jgi:hypothetical protein